jgi:hypothetical protein
MKVKKATIPSKNWDMVLRIIPRAAATVLGKPGSLWG